MRLSMELAFVALALIDVASASPSLGWRSTGRPEPLPPEPTLFISRANAAANITVPLAPTTIPTSPPSPAPTPLDLAVSYALSDSCLLYLTSTLSSATFQSCLPFSLLLTTSTSYASLLSSSRSKGDLETLNQLLAYTSSPQPGSETCDQHFSGVLSGLNAKSNCAADLAKGTAAKGIGKEVQAGIGNYKLMREASALADPDTARYCYLQAVASPTPDDLYLWSLPSGISLPPSSIPTCSTCSRLLIAHYSESLDSTPTLNGTILQNAINTINSQCGAAFVTYKASSQASSSASPSTSAGVTSWSLILLLGVVVSITI